MAIVATQAESLQVSWSQAKRFEGVFLFGF